MLSGPIIPISPTIGADKSAFASITMDLATCEQHSLALDLDFSSPNNSVGPPCTSILPLIESTLKLQLLSHVKHFTYIIAARHGGRGFHIHLPEFVIGHDDYILFCHQHSVPLQYAVQGNGLYKLDIFAKYDVGWFRKITLLPYRPMEMIYVDEKETYCIDFRKNLLEGVDSVEKSFKRVKH
ncbi:SF3 helicase domain-containing protein, partial [Trichonephila clavipes]